MNAAKRADGCVVVVVPGNLFAWLYLRGMRDRVNRRVNRICSRFIPKEAYEREGS